MQRKASNNKMRSRRWANFRRRADYTPEDVYRHRTRGWAYIPIHPFGDEPELLARLSLVPEGCHSVDSWWGIDGDATLLHASVGVLVGLYAKPTPHWERWVYLAAFFDAPYVTR